MPFVEPTLLRSEDDVGRILRAARTQTVGAKRDWGGLADMSDVCVEGFLAARRILTKPDDATYPDDLRVAIEHLRAAMDPKRTGSRLEHLVKRWDHVEARRDISRTLAARDASKEDAEEEAVLGMTP